MRHRSGQRKLNITDGAHRIAMLRNMSNSLIRHERIKTTLIRAKELRRFVEPLITLGKKPSVANRRLAFSRLQDRASVSKIFDDFGERFAEHPGGYLRILKHGFRPGDNAPIALVELTIRKEPELIQAEPKKKKRAAADEEAPDAAADSAEAAENSEGADSAAEGESEKTAAAESADSTDSAETGEAAEAADSAAAETAAEESKSADAADSADSAEGAEGAEEADSDNTDAGKKTETS